MPAAKLVRAGECGSSGRVLCAGHNYVRGFLHRGSVRTAGIGTAARSADKGRAPELFS